MPVSRKRKPKAGNIKGASAGTTKLPDRRAMEAFLVAAAGERRDDALDAAQDIMWDAWDSVSSRQRIALAKKALAISPLCADAYVMLAQEEARSPIEAIEFYQRGIAAGELALGPAAFVEDVGHFWGILETRPYMRARHGLAMGLWEMGQRAEAVEHYQEMLRLNPNDNQGIRYMLLNALLELGREAETAALLERYDDGAATWLWGKLLFAFRRDGDGPATRQFLADALAQNPHVVDYLIGGKRLPARRPDYITWGGEDEAQECVRDAAPAWRATPGALVWLAEATMERARPPRRKRSGSRAKADGCAR